MAGLVRVVGDDARACPSTRPAAVPGGFVAVTAADDLPGLRALAGEMRAVRHLRQIGEAAAVSPHRAEALARQHAFMNRVLTRPGVVGAPFVDWLGVWAMAHTATHDNVEVIRIEGAKSISLGGRTPAVLQLIDAAIMPMVASGCAATAHVTIGAAGAGVTVRLACAPSRADRQALEGILSMAATSGLPAACGFDGDTATLTVLAQCDPRRCAARSA